MVVIYLRVFFTRLFYLYREYFDSYTPLNVVKIENFIFRNFLKNDPIGGNFMRETRWRCYFCVKTLVLYYKIQKF
jgi:hypothetical protein